MSDVHERRVHKKLHWTVTPIGGKEEWKRWKGEQARKQKQWDDTRQERYMASEARSSAINMLMGEVPLRKLTAEERAEIEYSMSRGGASDQGVSYTHQPKKIINNIKDLEPKKTTLRERISDALIKFVSLAFEK